MRTISKVALAVAATLVGGAAFALPPGTTYGVKLNVAGSSAFQATFKTEFGNLCSDTLDTYVASVASGSAPNMQAYSCTLTAASGLPAGTKAIAYYRAEGGSVWGVGPIAKGLSILRLEPNVVGNCTGASPSYTCLVNGFNFNNDTITSGAAVSAPVQLGISDVEPAQFVGENWVDSTDGAGKLGAGAPTTAQLANITNSVVVAGQAFAVYVNSSVSSTSINISKQSLTSIFSGLYTDWSQVPKADGSGFLPAGAINVCLRDAGSGTQAGASIFFNNQNCSSSSFAFVGSPFPRNNSTGNATSGELGCIASHAGAIGFATIQGSAPAGTSIVLLDGVTPSRANSANGSYGYWFEGTFNYNSTLTGSANENALAQTLITRLQTAATIPASSANTFALPVGSNSPVLPVDTSHPIALGTRQGNSCFLPQGFN